MPGRCFRLIARAGGGGPAHCPEPPIWLGSWRAPNGRRTGARICDESLDLC
jgi:hypothetical protein